MVDLGSVVGRREFAAARRHSFLGVRDLLVLGLEGLTRRPDVPVAAGGSWPLGISWRVEVS